MKSGMRLICLAMLSATILWGQQEIHDLVRKAPENSLILRNVNLVDISQDQPVVTDVWVRYGRIYALGDSSQWALPEHTHQMNASQKYIMPTLSEMHYHMPGPKAHPAVIQAHLFFLLANGVTQVRVPFGEKNHPSIKAKVQRGEWLGPQLWLASRPVLDRKGYQDTATKMREAIFQARADGFDLIKSYGISDPEIYRAAVTATKELNMPFFGHVSNTLDMDLVLAAGQGVEHFSGYQALLQKDWRQLDALVAKSKAQNIFNGPTSLWYLQVYETDPQVYQNYRGTTRMPDSWRQVWDERRSADKEQLLQKQEANQKVLASHEKVFRAFHKAGLPLLISGAVPEPHLVPGFSLLHALETYTQWGMTPREAFQSATHHASAYLGLEHEWGHLRVGQVADFLLLGENPLEDVRHLENLEAIVLKGAYLSADLLDRGIQFHLNRVEGLQPW